jgi:hypothetical protein
MRTTFAVIAALLCCGAMGDTVMLDIPSRYMWGWGMKPPGISLAGYCGSTSLQSAALYYGNWISSEIWRDAAGGELLIAVNEDKAASQLHMRIQNMEIDFDYNVFLDWAVSQLDKQRPVVLGVYERQPDGDKDYDHIVPVIGYTKEDKKVTELHYNDLWSRQTRKMAIPEDIRTRREASGSMGEQPYTYFVPSKIQYAIAVLGIEDDNGETFPTKLVAPDWTEPDYGKEDERHDTPVPFEFTAKVSGLTKGAKYSILRFDHHSMVPDRDFIEGSYAKRVDFTADGSEHTLSKFDTVSSDASAFYRTVLNTDGVKKSGIPRPPKQHRRM